VIVGTTVSATVDLGDVDVGMAAIARRAHSLGPVMKQLVAPVREDQREHRKERSGPEQSWAPRSAKTIAAAHGKRKMSRSLLGRLPTAVSYKATAYSVTGVSKVRWSGAHQDGDRVGHGVTLPARTFLWLSGKLLDIADNIVARALVGAWGGR